MSVCLFACLFTSNVEPIWNRIGRMVSKELEILHFRCHCAWLNPLLCHFYFHFSAHDFASPFLSVRPLLFDGYIALPSLRHLVIQDLTMATKFASDTRCGPVQKRNWSEPFFEETTCYTIINLLFEIYHKKYASCNSWSLKYQSSSTSDFCFHFLIFSFQSFLMVQTLWAVIKIVLNRNLFLAVSSVSLWYLKRPCANGEPIRCRYGENPILSWPLPVCLFNIFIRYSLPIDSTKSSWISALISLFPGFIIALVNFVAYCH